MVRRLGVGIEDTIAGITEAWNNEFVAIELRVDSTNIDSDVGVFLLNIIDTGLSGDDAEDADIFDAPFFQGHDGHAGRAAGGEHGIEYDGDIGGATFWQFAVVFDRFGGRFIAIHTEVPYFGIREKFEEWIDQSETSPKDWDEGDFGGELFGDQRRDGSFDCVIGDG